MTAAVAALRRTDHLLTLTGLGMLAALGAFAVGLVLDPRVVLGAPVWLKPAKFAASIAIYTLTLAWAFRYLPEWPRLRRRVSVATSVALVIEIAIIAGQAARGTTSHFNVATALDGVLFTIMGVTIVLQTLASIPVAIALWRQRFADDTLGWALRLGLIITIAGASLGGLMTRPTETQMSAVRATGRMPVAGAHTVGAPDGGPGLPGTGWSVEHGDLRVPHFVGLHAFQALPLIAWVLARRGWTGVTGARAIRAIAASYALLLAILVWQALRGQPLVRPDLLTVIALVLWACGSIAALAAIGFRRNGIGAALHAR
jgi:hypothetical protein